MTYLNVWRSKRKELRDYATWPLQLMAKRSVRDCVGQWKEKQPSGQERSKKSLQRAPGLVAYLEVTYTAPDASGLVDQPVEGIEAQVQAKVGGMGEQAGVGAKAITSEQSKPQKSAGYEFVSFGIGCPGSLGPNNPKDTSFLRPSRKALFVESLSVQVLNHLEKFGKEKDYRAKRSLAYMMSLIGRLGPPHLLLHSHSGFQSWIRHSPFSNSKMTLFELFLFQVLTPPPRNRPEGLQVIASLGQK